MMKLLKIKMVLLTRSINKKCIKIIVVAIILEQYE